MSLSRLSLVSIACGAAVFAQARADDLTTQLPPPPRTSKAKAVKPAKVTPSRSRRASAASILEPLRSARRHDGRQEKPASGRLVPVPDAEGAERRPVAHCGLGWRWTQVRLLNGEPSPEQARAGTEIAAPSAALASLLEDSGLAPYATGWAGVGNRTFMRPLASGLVWIVCGAAACTQALADDLTPQQSQPPPTSAAEGQGAEGRQARAVASGRRRRRQVLEPLRSARRRGKGDGRGFPGSPDSHVGRSERRGVVHLQMACDQRARGPLLARARPGPRRSGQHVLGRTETRFLTASLREGWHAA